MAFKKTLLHLLKNPSKIPTVLGINGCLNWMSDKSYIKLVYKCKLHKKLNIENPVTYTEKLQWLKLYDRNPLYSTLVDKYAVRQYIDDTLGKGYLTELLGLYNTVEEIDWNALPNKFALKCTHGSSCNLLCTDKSKLDIESAKSKLNKYMKTNWYYFGREWPYKNVKPRIICEEFLEEEIFNYKFYCFGGVPKFLHIEYGDNAVGEAKVTYIDFNWELCPFFRTDHKQVSKEKIPPKPENFEEMLKIAKILSADKKFVRIDLFNLNGKIYFSEITFFPGAGFAQFNPPEYEKKIGDMITI